MHGVREQVQPVLGVFQKLIASKANDHHGFALMTGMIRALPLNAIQKYLPTVFQLLFQRLSSLKTHKFVREFIGFMSAFVCTHGAGQLFELVDAVQPNIMMMILDQVWLPGLASVNGKRERKVAAIALIKLVCDCPSLRDPVQLSLWNKAAAGVVPLLENIGEDDEGNDEPGTVHAFALCGTSLTARGYLTEAPETRTVTVLRCTICSSIHFFCSALTLAVIALRCVRFRRDVGTHCILTASKRDHHEG